MIRNKIKIVVAIYLLLNLTGLKIFGQISTDERPISFNYDENMFKTRSENLRTMPTIDLEALETKYNFLMKKCYFSIFLIVFFITNRRGANMVTYNIANIPRKILRKVCNANATAARNAAKNILLVATLSIFIATFSSCKDEPVTKIPEVPSLLNTKWKCLGFFDVEANEFKEQEIPCSWLSFTLFFDTDTTTSGMSCGNAMEWEYHIDYSSLVINFTKFIAYPTYVGETEDGERYRGTFRHVQSFSLINEKLKLFYHLPNNESGYLLFRPFDIEAENPFNFEEVEDEKE